MKKILSGVDLPKRKQEEWTSVLGGKVRSIRVVQSTGADAKKIDPKAEKVILIEASGGTADW